jgi:hypothetical protein
MWACVPLYLNHGDSLFLPTHRDNTKDGLYFFMAEILSLEGLNQLESGTYYRPRTITWIVQKNNEAKA